MSKKLPLTHALAWIVGSTFLVSGSAHLAIKHYMQKRALEARDHAHAIHSIIQTGPQKEALKTEYLAEVLDLSVDRPYSALHYNVQKAKLRLLRSPLIASAQVKLIKPDTLYVDYTVRQPSAWLEDYRNIAIDKDGYPFPFTPFFSPKNLPSIYFGLAPFGMETQDPDRPAAKWGAPLQGKYVDLAFDVLKLVTDPKSADLFSIKRIDVSNAFAESYGTREIVVITEDTILKGQTKYILPRILRLSTKNYSQELGNYLKLREQMLAEEQKKIAAMPEGGAWMRVKEKIIDFRVQKLAFIDETK